MAKLCKFFLWMSTGILDCVIHLLDMISLADRLKTTLGMWICSVTNMLLWPKQTNTNFTALTHTSFLTKTTKKE
jgi:hypothetical protein